MTLAEASEVIDAVLASSHSENQKRRDFDYSKEKITSIGLVRAYDGKIERRLSWSVYINFGYIRRGKSRIPITLHIPVNNDERREKLLEALYLWQDHLNFSSVEPDIGNW